MESLGNREEYFYLKKYVMILSIIDKTFRRLSQYYEQ